MTPIRLNIPSSSSSPQHDEENQEEYPSHVLLTLKPTSPLSTVCSSSTPCQEKKDHGVRDQPLKGADQKEGEGLEEKEEEEEEEKLLDQADPGFSTSNGSGTEDDDHLPLRSSPPIMFMGSQCEINEGYKSTKPVHVIVDKQAVDDHGDHHGRGTDHNCNDGSTHVMKWMSSKMRVMKKMANYNPDHHQTPSDPKPAFMPFQSRQRSPPPCDDDNSTTIDSPKIRVCSDCNTTKTPLWRSGPQGPKSLCNACGIRQRKARRAMAAAAAAAANGTQLLSVETSDNMRSSTSTSASNKGAIKEKRSSSSGSTDGFSCRQYKKRCKLGAGGPRSRKKIRFDEFTISTSLSKTSAAFHQAVFPRDEEEAAILLMALSCGLVRG